MNSYLSIAQIVIAVALVLAMYRTRRGIEKTLFQLTILLSVLFVVVAIIALRVKS